MRHGSRERKEGERERKKTEGHLGKGRRSTSEQRSEPRGGEREVKERARGDGSLNEGLGRSET